MQMVIPGITVALAITLIVLALRWENGHDRFLSVFLFLIAGGGGAFLSRGGAAHGWPVTTYGVPATLAAGLILAILFRRHGISSIPTGLSALLAFIGTLASCCAWVDGILEIDAAKHTAEERRRNAEARKEFDAAMASALQRPPADMTTLRKHAIYTIVDSKNDIIVLEAKGVKRVFLRVPKDVADVIVAGYSIRDQLPAIEAAMGAPAERRQFPRLTHDQLTVTHGIVKRKYGDLGQRVLIIDINGKEVVFEADEDAFTAVAEGTRLPLDR